MIHYLITSDAPAPRITELIDGKRTRYMWLDERIWKTSRIKAPTRFSETPLPALWVKLAIL